MDWLLKALPSLCVVLRWLTRKKPQPPAVLWALVVEDDANDAYFIELALRRCGFQVQIEPSAEAARGNLRRNVYDLILVDLRLPGMSGAALLRVLSNETPFARCVVVTGDPCNLPASEPVIMVVKPVTDESIRKLMKLLK